MALDLVEDRLARPHHGERRDAERAVIEIDRAGLERKVREHRMAEARHGHRLSRG